MDIHYGQICSFYRSRLSEFHMLMHAHDRFELMYAVNGSCEVKVAGKTNQLPNNVLVFIAPKVPHQLTVSPRKACTVLNLEFTLSQCSSDHSMEFSLDRLFTRCSNVMRFITELQSSEGYFTSKDSGLLFNCFNELLNGLILKDDRYYIHLLFEKMLVILSKMSLLREPVGHSYIKQAMSFIDDNYNNQIRVADVAAHVGIHPSYLQSLFSKYEKISVNSYIQKKRMEQAVFLLKYTDTSITEICLYVGFNSPQHFRHSFRKVYQMSPSSYREICRGKPADTATEHFEKYRYEIS